MTQFRTGWFQESVVSAALIVLVVRTRHLFFRNRPVAYLFWATFLVVAVTLLFPYTALGVIFGFTPLPPLFLAVLSGVILLYVAGAEVLKAMFYRWVRF